MILKPQTALALVLALTAISTPYAWQIDPETGAMALKPSVAEARRGGDDDSSDDSGSGHGGDDDRGSDDSGSGHGGSDDSSDDSGSDDSGSDDSGSDDNGSDDRGSDDRSESRSSSDDSSSSHDSSDDRGGRRGRGQDDGPTHDLNDDNPRGTVTTPAPERSQGGGTVAKAESAGGNIEVVYTDGWKEEIENGRYELKDASGRTVVQRAATAGDVARLSVALQ